jgi:hypothetical protein
MGYGGHDPKAKQGLCGYRGAHIHPQVSLQGAAGGCEPGYRVTIWGDRALLRWVDGSRAIWGVALEPRLGGGTPGLEGGRMAGPSQQGESARHTPETTWALNPKEEGVRLPS